MKFWVKFWIRFATGAVLFSFLLPSMGWARTSRLSKLTSDGVLEIRIQPPAKPSSETPEKSISEISVRRRSQALESSKWKALAKKDHLKIAVVGDSGCRLKESKRGDEYQDCKDPKTWPFPQVMRQVAKERPDLILHLGDYHYREQCTKGKPCEKMSAVVGYGWEPWKKDFFEPAAVTFPMAPWIFVRGNHEDCHRAFFGYFHLMANEDFSANCRDYEEADIIRLKNLWIVNLDTSAVPEAVDPSKENEALWVKRFQEIDAKATAAGVSKIWLVTHKPFYGLVKQANLIAPVNPNLKKYLEASPLKSKINMILAGHIHVSQVIKPKDSPLQLVLGNGGTQLDDFQEAVMRADLSGLGLQSVQSGSPGFGYAMFERAAKSSDWKVEFKDPSGQVNARCEFRTELGVCEKK